MKTSIVLKELSSITVIIALRNGKLQTTLQDFIIFVTILNAKLHIAFTNL